MPRLLDLFCGAGGAAMGYHRAGFDVVGVDIKPQPRYPFEFHQADALTFPLVGFDAIHASPPCQDWSQLHRNYGAAAHGTAALLGETLILLHAQRRAWVVENVVGAPLPTAIELCGASFGLGASGLDLNRHRRFQMSFYVLAPPCQHRPGHTIGVYGNGTNRWHREKLGRNLSAAEQREAMGIDWMPRADLAQAIPPAYTEWVGRQLMRHLGFEPPEEELMPRKITPPKYRGGKHLIPDGQGEAPKPAPSSAADPPPLRRCGVCRRMRPDCVRQLYPPEPARWTCHPCLEAAGQLPLEPS